MTDQHHSENFDVSSALCVPLGEKLSDWSAASEPKQMMTFPSHAPGLAERFPSGRDCQPEEAVRAKSVVFDELDDLPCPADSDPVTWARLPREIRASFLRARAAQAKKLARRAAKGGALPFDLGEEGLRVEGTPPGMSGAPKRLLQLPLFAVIAPGARRVCENESLPGPDGMELFYTGPRLDQNDLTCYMAVMNLYRARKDAALSGVGLSLYMLLRELGQSNCGGNRAAALDRLRRLAAGEITLVVDGQRRTGTLLKLYENEAQGRLWIEPEREFQPLYLGEEWQRLEWDVRLALGRDQLALALWSYFRTFARPFPIRVETLRERVGSATSGLNFFRANVKKALKKIAATLVKTQNAPLSWSIDEDDRLCVEWSDGKKREIKSTEPARF